MAKPEVRFRNAKPKERAYKLADEFGLFMRVMSTGAKYWQFKYRFEGKERLASFGTYPETSLERARQLRDQAREKLRAGTAPTRQALRLTSTLASASPQARPNFGEVTELWLNEFSPTWSVSHLRKTRIRLNKHALPYMSTWQIDAIDTPMLKPVIDRIIASNKVDTAHAVRMLLGQIFRYAVASGLRANDPTAALRGAFRPHVVKNLGASTTVPDATRLIRAVSGYSGGETVRLLLLLSAHLFQRPGNIRMMEWSEIDEENSVWRIPSSKMKRSLLDKENGADHLVPLSNQSLMHIRKLRRITDGGRYCFPNARSHLRPMSDNAANAALRSMGFEKDEATAHGFRAMARTILDEVLEVPVSYIEAQLAHKVSDLNGTAYNRTSHLAQRRRMMQLWSDYLESLISGKNDAALHW